MEIPRSSSHFPLSHRKERERKQMSDQQKQGKEKRKKEPAAFVGEQSWKIGKGGGVGKGD